MIEDYYTRVGVINANPQILSDLGEEDRAKLKNSLTRVSEQINGDDAALTEAIEEFITVFDQAGLGDQLGDVAKTRGLGLKQETKLPRLIINDVTIMTLKNL